MCLKHLTGTKRKEVLKKGTTGAKQAHHGQQSNTAPKYNPTYKTVHTDANKWGKRQIFLLELQIKYVDALYSRK